jgi:hypothetical protein
MLRGPRNIRLRDMKTSIRAQLRAGHRSGISVFVCHISGSQWPCLVFSTSCHATYRWGANRRVSWETPAPGRPPPLSPPTRKKKPKENHNKKRGRALLLVCWDCIDSLPITPVGLVLNCCCLWLCCCSISSCCSIFPFC